LDNRRKHYCFFIYYYQYSALGLVWAGTRAQSGETGVALLRCILGKVLEVVCHCSPPSLDVPTFAARCLHVLLLLYRH